MTRAGARGQFCPLGSKILPKVELRDLLPHSFLKAVAEISLAWFVCGLFCSNRNICLSMGQCQILKIFAAVTLGIGVGEPPGLI